jgi:CBS domain-containing protein
LSDEDIYQAMRQVPGYLDITPGDFRLVYALAFRHAWQRLADNRLAREVMTSPAVAVEANDSLASVAHTLAQAGVAGAPVLDAGRVVGVISEKDILERMGGEAGLSFMAVVARCLGGEACGAISLRRQSARQVMSAPPVTVGPESSVAEITRLMAQKGVNRVPVVNPAGGLLGIVTRSDLLPRAGSAGKP